ncbi:COP9 signalosome complex subunit 2 [Pelomyxa schiedti]|nr:COP9 signalosome complex subunit 2 [Pelomyxa schiedti]
MMSDDDMDGFGDEGDEFEDTKGGDDEDAVDDDEPTADNEYYNGKNLMEEDVAEALKAFRRAVDLEKPKGDFGFKALKKIVKIKLANKDWNSSLTHFKELLTYIKSAVAANTSEKGLNTLLELVAATNNVSLTQQMYETATKALLEANNQRLWFRVNSKLAQVLLDSCEYGKLKDVVAELHKWCTVGGAGVVDDPKKASNLIEIYALEIQLQTALEDTDKLKELSRKAAPFTGSIPHPRVLGVIRQASGIAAMSDGDWAKANQDFFDAFKNFDEAGDGRRLSCLKYLVFARMIELSEINPFSSPETIPYKKHEQITIMVKLWEAYEKLDIKKFEEIINTSGPQVKSDHYLCPFIPQLLTNVRKHAMLSIIKPYRRVKLDFVSSAIGINPGECERLLVSLILDNKIRGKIDQMNKLILVDAQQSVAFSKYIALTKWSRQLKSVVSSFNSKIA